MPVEVPMSLNDIVRKDEDGDDDYNTMFGFSAPWLPDYFRANFTSLFSYDNKFLMLKMVVGILTMKDRGAQSRDMPMTTQTRVRTERELVSYASGSWSEYVDIGDDSRMDRKEDGARLVSKVMCNENGAMRRLEDHCRVKNPERLSILSEVGFRHLQELCSGISFAMVEDADARHLVEQVSGGSAMYSLYAARKHVQSWWTAKTPLDAHTSFQFARRAVSQAFEEMRGGRSYEYLKERIHNSLGLKLEVADVKSLIEITKPSFESTHQPRRNLEEIQKEEIRHIKLLSESFGGWRSLCGGDCKINARDECRRATQLRCRAMALRFNGHFKEALEDINKALSCQKLELGEEWKFKLLDRKGRIHFGQLEDIDGYHSDMTTNPERDPFDEKRIIALNGASSAFKRALGVISENIEGRYDEKIFMIHQMSAKVAAMLDKADDSLQSVGKATKDILDGGPQVLVYFKDIVSIMAANKRWGQINELLAKVPRQQLAAGCTSQTHEALHRAAAKGEEANRRILDSMYEESVRALQSGSMLLPANSVRVWWAIFKRHIKKDLIEAKDILQDVLRSSESEVDVQTITSASWQLGEILLGEFYGADSSAANESAGEMLTRREEIHERMIRLVRTVTNLVPNFQSELSQTSILLTLMEVGMGSIKLAQRQANTVFDACWEALTDDKASNDLLGFQMLAKILAVVPALTEDAKNAASCQFYIVDEQLYKHETQEPDVPSPGDGYDPILPLEQKAPPDGRRSSRPGIPKARKREDLEYYAAFQAVKCGGSCGRVIGPNLERSYLCYYCTNTTLCEECYRSRRGSQDEWRVRCPAYHRHVEFSFLKANGVTKKDPVLSNEEYRELQGWLKGLKGKWNKAWIDFVQIAISDGVRSSSSSQSSKRQRTG